jgi:CRP-like cAMP-binding protein
MTIDDLFTDKTEVHSVRAGQALFRQGEPGDVMYVLITGTADILVGDKVIESAGAGEFLGEMALVDSGPRAATVIAATDCRLVPIDVERFHLLVREAPHFATEVMKTMARRLRKIDRKVEQAG